MLPPLQGASAALNGPPPMVVEGSLVAPVAPALLAAAPLAPVSGAPAGEMVTAKRQKHGRAPEHFSLYFALFAVLVFAITIAACFALLLFASAGIHHLL